LLAGEETETPKEEPSENEVVETAVVADEGPLSANADGPTNTPVAEMQLTGFTWAETLLIFDWDDTILPSTWLVQQGLRLDPGSEVSTWHQEQLTEVARHAIEVLRAAKQFGTVVLVTNAERGWIELSCQKFLPMLYTSLENIPIISARTTYETPEVQSPLDWKLRAFEREILQFFGADCLAHHERRKNVVSLGDSVHEREALIRTTAGIPSCRSKCVKFVERPDISQIVKQHALVLNGLNQIIHHDGPLDLHINCP
jgi:hypothetical protein